MGKIQAAGLLCVSALLGLPFFGQSVRPDSNARSNEIPLQIIVVSTPEQAHQVLEKLSAGYDFATLAREKSIDATANSGGYMGRMDPAALRSELREALNRLGSGQLTSVTHIPSGYAILKVLPEKVASELENATIARLQAMSSFGSVVYSPVVSGIGEAEEAFLRFPKPEGWEQDSLVTCEVRKDSL